MSHKAMSWAVEVRAIPISTKAILMLLAEHHNRERNQCNPSIETLCNESGLKRRAVLGHLSTLEEGGLIKRETRSLGRGNGKRTDFILFFNITAPIQKPENDDLEVQENARAKEYTCKSEHLEVQARAPAYKEEPEGTGNSKVDQPDFEQAWTLYQSCKLKASGQQKKKAREQWRKVTSRADPSEILKAIRITVDMRRAPKGFMPNLPDMFRWLRDDRWQDVLAEAKPKLAEPSLEDWQVGARLYVDSTGNSWPSWLGPPPHDPDCRAPAGIVNRIRRELEGNPAAPVIPKPSEAA